MKTEVVWDVRYMSSPYQAIQPHQEVYIEPARQKAATFW